MCEQVDAIYDQGVLKPLVPLSLPDKARVKVTVEATLASDSADANVDRKHVLQGTDAPGIAEGFDDQLTPLLFDGPSLPADFSRADIYADHD